MFLIKEVIKENTGTFSQLFASHGKICPPPQNMKRVNFRVPDSWGHKKFIQKLFPADFTTKVECRIEDFNEGSRIFYFIDV